MARIYETTMAPTKMELLAAWLPGQAWFLTIGEVPALTRVGGFRLDDPSGEVGIEFLLVRDDSGPQPTVYNVPMTYRGAPLQEGSEALIGVAEHGVLGPRWIYDATCDPVAMHEIRALVAGRAHAQHASRSGTADASVRVESGHASSRDEVTVIRVPVAGAAVSAGVTACWDTPGGAARGLVIACGAVPS